ISQDAVLLINASALSAPIPQHWHQQLQQLYRLAFSVWRAQTDRAERWSLTTAPASGVSCLLGPVLMLHRYYAYLMSSPFAERLRRVASVFDGCDLLAWSFLVSHVTGRPPAQLLEHRTAWAQPEFLGSRQLCLQPLANALGSAMPLTVSRARMDPVS
uniref:Glyco_transf_64 domain-containing protein n=1 Tax=Macrostomum lignano TaxID=282301 RepID=A0A1I8IEN4_9PLAT